MKYLIVLSALAAVAFGKPGFAPLTYTIVPQAYSYSNVITNIPTTYAYSSVAVPPVQIPHDTVYHAPALATYQVPTVGLKTQYNYKDEFGRTVYGHSEPLQSHSAVQDARGNKIGSFSYVDPTGRVIRTDYVADEFGYRVSSNALPVSPTETPEVAAARAAHLAHHHTRAKRHIADVYSPGRTPASTSPLGAGVPLPSFEHFAPFVAYEVLRPLHHYS